MLKVYEYKNCSTCKKALKFLDSQKIEYSKISIVEQPPSKAELKKMLLILKKNGEGLKKLFNTSGQMYRELRLGEKLNEMSEDSALTLLSKHGKLIKRPFAVTANSGLVGFQEAAWKKLIQEK